jgi:hypothetical protein
LPSGIEGPYRVCLSMQEVITDGVRGQSKFEVSWNWSLATFFGLAAIFAFSVLYHAPESNYVTICPFKNATGLPCPGCGLTHSFCALAKGHLTSAFGYNVLGPPLFLILVLLWLRCAVVLVGKPEIAHAFDQLMMRIKLAHWFVVSLLIFGVFRIAYLIVFDPSIWRDGYIYKLVVMLHR